MIVWEGKTPGGATVVIHDDYMAPRGSEQERRIAEQQRRVAHEILASAARRQGIARTGAGA